MEHFHQLQQQKIIGKCSSIRSMFWQWWMHFMYYHYFLSGWATIFFDVMNGCRANKKKIFSFPWVSWGFTYYTLLLLMLQLHSVRGNLVCSLQQNVLAEYYRYKYFACGARTAIRKTKYFLIWRIAGCTKMLSFRSDIWTILGSGVCRKFVHEERARTAVMCSKSVNSLSI